jgi:hypothetical protein
MKSALLVLACLGLACLARADAPPADAPCAAACGPTHKVCTPEETTKKTDKVVYDYKCVDYCLPRCSFFSSLWGHGCGCGNCGAPRVRRVLIKRVVHEECPDVKCTVEERPCGPLAP